VLRSADATQRRRWRRSERTVRFWRGIRSQAGGLSAMANQLGKRFECPECGTETLCTKGGTGTVKCCGQPMQLKEPKPLPSAD
jgi:hypothetical protein